MKIDTGTFFFSLLLVGSDILVNAQSSYKCPEDKDKTIIRNDKNYRLHCAEGIRGLAFETVPGDDAVQCAEACAANSACKHVTHNGKTSMCELKKDGELFPYTRQPYMTWYFIGEVATAPITGDTGDNAQKPETGDASTGPSDNSSSKTSYSCPEDNLETYTTGGITYELRCGHGHATGHWRPEPAETLKECADRCAAIEECNSCDFQRHTKECYLMKAPSVSTPWSGNLGDAWYPAQCPDVRATKASEKPEVTSDISCPENDGKISEGSDGTWFYLQCCTTTDTAAVLDLVPVSNEKECLEKCVISKKCKSFTYTAPGGSTSNCKLYGHGKFSQLKQPGALYAFATDPPTEESKVPNTKLCSTKCPDAHGQLFVSPTGENFQITCDKRHGTTYLKIDRRPSFEACMSACAAMTACHSAEYEPRTQKCYYGNNHNQPGIDAKAFMSAHSLGCAGACSTCKKGCDGLDDEPLPPDVPGCDGDHGSIITSGGEDFRLQCRHCYRSNSSFKAEGAMNMGDCAKACADNSNCHGANWMGPVTGCWMHPAAETNGEAVQFYRDSRCDALMPQNRGLANFGNAKVDNPPFITRDW